MYRVSQFFWIYNGNSLREPIKGLYVGPAEKRSFMVVRRRCRFVKDYGSRENYEKSFSVHNDEINVHHAQLIFNTHNPLYLNNNLFH